MALVPESFQIQLWNWRIAKRFGTSISRDLEMDGCGLKLFKLFPIQKQIWIFCSIKTAPCQLWNFLEGLEQKVLTKFFRFWQAKGIILRCRMAPKFNNKPRLLFRWKCWTLLSVGSIWYTVRHGKSTVNPDVHEMYDLSMGCYLPSSWQYTTTSVSPRSSTGFELPHWTARNLNINTLTAV